MLGGSFAGSGGVGVAGQKRAYHRGTQGSECLGTGEADVWGQPEDRKIETRRAASERGVSGMVDSARPRVLAQARHGRKIRASKGRD